MHLIHPTSLAATLDAFNAAHFANRTIPLTDRKELAAFLASRIETHGSYAGMPAPTPHDFEHKVRLFTGEKLSSHACIAHVLGEEACRTLLLLNVRAKSVREPLARATRGIASRVANDDRHYRQPSGRYCCAQCSVGLWRHLLAGGLDHQQDRLRHGISTLTSRRTPDGRWKTYPFYYTLLALLDMPLAEAQTELEYVAPACARLLSRNLRGTSPYPTRRRALLERVLARCPLPN